MTCRNLALAFEPFIFRSQCSSQTSLPENIFTGLDSEMEDCPINLKADLLEFLIEHAEKICKRKSLFVFANI